MKISKIEIPTDLQTIVDKIISFGGKPYLVGGAVRDKLLNQEIKDYDLEIYQLTNEELEQCLSNFGQVILTGKVFGVYRLKNYSDYEFALPRLETQVGNSHKSFEIEVNPHLNLKQACKRRDFTINALMYDFTNQEVLDFYGGIDDLKNGVLKAVNEQTFIEDPQRILRLANFLSRYNFKVDKKTYELCRDMVKDKLLDNLSKERLYEGYSAILMNKQPSIGFKFLNDIKGLLPCLQVLENTIQNPKYHPEGNVFNHTMLVVDLSALCSHKTSNPLAFMWGMLLHDIGKALVTTPDGHAKGHQFAGVKVFDEELLGLISQKKMQKYIRIVIKYHMDLFNMYRRNAGDYAYYRLLEGLENTVTISDMILVNRCDKMGRLINNQKQIAGMEDYIQEKINRLGSKLLQPIIRGKDLIALGLEESKIFRQLLDLAYDYQKKGLKKDEILELIEAKINEKR